jgi:hypothetical protein
VGEREGAENDRAHGGKRGRLAESAQQAIVIEDEHYGRVEDLHMTICHMLCYAFMELPELRAESGGL